MIKPTVDEITADAFIMLKRCFHGVHLQYERKRKAKEAAESFINRIDTFAGLSEDISLSTVDSDKVLYQSAIESGGLKTGLCERWTASDAPKANVNTEAFLKEFENYVLDQLKKKDHSAL